MFEVGYALAWYTFVSISCINIARIAMETDFNIASLFRNYRKNRAWFDPAVYTQANLLFWMVISIWVFITILFTVALLMLRRFIKVNRLSSMQKTDDNLIGVHLLMSTLMYSALSLCAFWMRKMADPY